MKTRSPYPLPGPTDSFPPIGRLQWPAPAVRRARLLGAFKVGATAVFLLLGYSAPELSSGAAFGSLLIAFGALLPAYLWCSGRVPGVPLLPLFALTFLWTYAYPLVSSHPIIALYSDEAGFAAGAAVAMFLLLCTGAWFLVTTKPHQLPARIRAMVPGKGDYLFSMLILLAGLLTMSVVGQWFELESGLFSILRAALFGLSSVGIFALAYRWGKGELRGAKVGVFLAALVLYGFAQMSTLFLVSGVVAAILALVGFATGRRVVPWIWIFAFTLVFATLHAGKGDMREHYWYPMPEPVQPWDYPVFFARWVDAGVSTMASPAPEELAQPLYERVGLAHLLLKILDESPDRVPYLNGRTYAIVPQLLIPRAFSPDKIPAHEGTTILSVHYGLQSRDDTRTTTIGWGLLNEAAANFGVPGIIGLAIALGAGYGWVTRFAAEAPILSLRMLVAITFMVFAVQTEFTAGVYVSALFQSLVSLSALSLWFMDRTHETMDKASAVR